MAEIKKYVFRDFLFIRVAKKKSMRSAYPSLNVTVIYQMKMRESEREREGERERERDYREGAGGHET